MRRQLAKEDKQRINEMAKASKATKQKHKEDAEQEKKPSREGLRPDESLVLAFLEQEAKK